MRYYLVIFCFIFSLGQSVLPDEARFEAVFVTADATIDTDLYIKFKVSHSIHLIQSVGANKDLNWQLRKSSNDEPFWAGTGLRFNFGDSTIWFQLSAVTPDVVNSLFDSKNPSYLHVPKDVKIVDTLGILYDLSRELIKNQTLLALSISADSFTKIIAATTRAKFLAEDHFDFSREIDPEDTAQPEYVVTFDKTDALIAKRLYYRAQGRLSSNSESPLNKLDMTVGYILDENTHNAIERPFLLNILGEATLSGSQKLDTTVGKLRISFEGLTPNFIDLTGGSTRLRLKPIIKAGFGLVTHFQKQILYDEARTSIEAFANCYYYIPVLKEYALIYEAEVNYNGKRQIDDGFIFWNSLTLSYDLPLNDLKALFKWETGKSEFMTKNESRLLLGLLIDFVPL